MVGHVTYVWCHEKASIVHSITKIVKYAVNLQIGIIEGTIFLFPLLFEEKRSKILSYIICVKPLKNFEELWDRSQRSSLAEKKNTNKKLNELQFLSDFLNSESVICYFIFIHLMVRFSSCSDSSWWTNKIVITF